MLTLVFTVMFIASLMGRILLGEFADKVSFFPKLLTPLTWVTVGLGVIMVLFIGLEIYKRLRK